MKPIAFLVLNKQTGKKMVTMEEQEACDVAEGEEYEGLYTRKQLFDYWNEKFRVSIK